MNLSLFRPLYRAALVSALGLAAPAVVAAQPSDDAVEAPPDGARAHGRRGHHRRGHHGHHLRRALRQLNLSDNQKEQIRAIFESARERGRELRDGGRSPETREQMHALHRETKRLVFEVLTPAQRTQLEEMREQHEARRLDRRVEHMTERLELSEQQARQVRQIFTRAQNQRRAIHESERPHEQKREAMQALRQRTQAALSRVLTEEQAATLEQLREERRERGHRGHRGHGPRGHRGHGADGNGNRGI